MPPCGVAPKLTNLITKYVKESTEGVNVDFWEFLKSVPPPHPPSQLYKIIIIKKYKEIALITIIHNIHNPKTLQFIGSLDCLSRLGYIRTIKASNVVISIWVGKAKSLKF